MPYAITHRAFRKINQASTGFYHGDLSAFTMVDLSPQRVVYDPSGRQTRRESSTIFCQPKEFLWKGITL